MINFSKIDKDYAKRLDNVRQSDKSLEEKKDLALLLVEELCCKLDLDETAEIIYSLL